MTIHKCPAVGHLNRNVQLGSNALPMPGLPPPPSGLTLIGALRDSSNMGALAFCDLDCSSYKSLSFRIGAASLAAENGMSDAQIRGLGRWTN